jgi:hypothetical protein
MQSGVQGSESTVRSIGWLVLLLVALAAVRLSILGAYPLMDKTESRYAAVAREMAVSGDWLSWSRELLPDGVRNSRGKKRAARLTLRLSSAKSSPFEISSRLRNLPYSRS